MTLPKINTYGNYNSDNYGAHCMCVEVGPIDLYYSYRTLVAFRAPGIGLVVHENIWGPTTGKHLKWIDNGNKSSRVSSTEFDAKWKQVTEKYFFDDTLTPFQAETVKEMVQVVKTMHPERRR